jgi:hypothetical protein
MAEIGINTYDKDKEVYAMQKMARYNAQSAFFAGNLGAGLAAVNYIWAEYKSLYYRKHIKDHEATSKTFIKEMETLLEEIVKQDKKANADKPSLYDIRYMKLITEYRKLADRFDQIIMECEAKL